MVYNFRDFTTQAKQIFAMFAISQTSFSSNILFGVYPIANVCSSILLKNDPANAYYSIPENVIVRRDFWLHAHIIHVPKLKYLCSVHEHCRLMQRIVKSFAV